ncbi:Fpg/Nei family DNA glycosylase [Oerskovia sp. Sa1BUA8]|uniref:DNA-(apurinic or apyrimidinic site) lyase n=1 Tax=Oerskovia douganii TaxID=2762210 RepID=A0A9D5UCD9_9CELL|nr:zinc finger domain-containing protein [Oerskovia douganii]MBE7701446.1 Fpg/Nei family DNA glycosylase [Oerskovia douganii]
MPEGHTVHRLARTFAELFTGQVLAVSSPQGRFTAGAALLDGSRLAASRAWGKQLFLGFADPSVDPATRAEGPRPDDDLRWLRVHLGLYGAWTFAGDGSFAVVHAIGAPRRRIGERDSIPAGPLEPLATSDEDWAPPPPRGAVRVRLVGEHAVADLTGPTACEVVSADEVRAVEARLGPDPIRDDPAPAGGPDRFVTAVRRSRTSVGQLLMNQDVIAGVGNIYRAEALFRAGLDPLAAGRDVPAETLRAIWEDLVVLMRDGAATGAIVTTRPQDRLPDGAAHPGAAPRPGERGTVRQNTDGSAGAVPPDQAFYVYHRDGLPCRVCATPVLMKDLAGRKLYWCPTCQR